MIKLTVLCRFSYKMEGKHEFLPTNWSLHDLKRKRKVTLLDQYLISEVVPVCMVVDKGGIIVDYNLSPFSPLGGDDVELSLVRFNKTATYLVLETKAEVEAKMEAAS